MRTTHKIALAFTIIIVVALLAFLTLRHDGIEALRERLATTFTQTPPPTDLVSTAPEPSLIVPEEPLTPAPAPHQAPETRTASIVAAINGRRGAAGVPVLVTQPTLTSVAQQHANAMAARGFFAHTDPDGVTFQERIAASGYGGTANAENLGLTSSEAVSVVGGWMDSDAHRTNMLAPQYVAVGVGIANGAWQGIPVVFVVAVFGNEK